MGRAKWWSGVVTATLAVIDYIRECPLQYLWEIWKLISSLSNSEDYNMCNFLQEQTHLAS